MIEILEALIGTLIPRTSGALEADSGWLNRLTIRDGKALARFTQS
jgi:hypothetical protein